MTEQDLELVAAVPLRSEPMAPGTLRAAPGVEPEVTVELELTATEGAVALVEQDGVYQWSFAADEEVVLAQPMGRRAMVPGTRKLRFRLPMSAAAQPDARRRGWLTDFALERAQILVFKFAGRFLLEQGVKFLERKARTGLVEMAGSGLESWTDVADFSRLKLPDNRPARILLFVHGTFSSTRGGFAGLCATPWGRAFLEAARANYDAVVGFDHPTLSVDPRDNALALLRSLEARAWTQPVNIDVITHSRGGITLRSLTEELLPASQLPVRVERVVFVGATNGGTELANPRNWESLINLYTNLAAATCRAIASFPQAAPASLLFSELFKSVGVLAKVLVSEAVTRAAVPGLAAMQPDGPFIAALNRTQPGQPTPLNSRYYAVTSDFRSKLALEVSPELPRRLLLALADGGADQLMQVANDLVVHVASMTHVDPQAGTFIRDTLSFGENGVVYHTNYFIQPEVVNALVRWLEFEAPVQADRARTRGAVAPGAVRLELPAVLETDVLVLPADMPSDDAGQRIAEAHPHYVVVERIHLGERLLYAFTGEEMLSALARGGAVGQALGLQETGASNTREVSGAATRSARPSPSRPNTLRTVLLDQGMVLGVSESQVSPLPLATLRRQAAQWTTAQTPQAPSDPAATASTLKRALRGAVPLVPDAIAPFGVPSPQVASAAPLSTAPSVEKVKCQVLAEMDDEVLVNQDTSVDVIISQEALLANRPNAAQGVLLAQPDSKLLVELIPKKNFEARGNTRVQLDIPAQGAPVQCVFDVRGTHLGDGEICVRFRQGNLPLTTLTLSCRIVQNRVRPPQRFQVDASVLDQDLGPEPRHQLTILDTERGGQKMYLFIFESPSLGVRLSHESKPLQGSREEFINGIYNDLEQRYLSHAKDYDQFQQELREIGATLWDELVPEPIKAALWQYRLQIDSVQVLSEEPFIPWELVHLKEPGKGLPSETLFLAQMGVVRWLHNITWPARDLRARPGRCFYVIPEYPHPDYELPAALEEALFLQNKLAAQAAAPNAAAVRGLLQAPGSFDLLHFACHGLAESKDIGRAELLLQGRIEGANYVTEKLRASTIEQLSGLAGPDGVHPIVTLNACQVGRAGYKLSSIGGFARAFLKQNAGMVVAAMWSVGDQPARVFTESLYAALLSGKPLAQASNAAREAAREGKDSTWLAYTVYGNPNATLRTD